MARKTFGTLLVAAGVFSCVSPKAVPAPQQAETPSSPQSVRLEEASREKVVLPMAFDTVGDSSGDHLDDLMRAAPVVALAEFEESCPTDCRGGVTQLVLVRPVETFKGTFAGRAGNFAGWYVCPHRMPNDEQPVAVVGIVPGNEIIQHPTAGACGLDLSEREPREIQGRLSVLRRFATADEARRYALRITAP